MTTDPLDVQTDGVRTFAQTHADVAAGLSSLLSEEGADVDTSHGPIAAAVSTALSGVLSNRRDSLGATSTTASTISDLLQKAADAYARGDEQDAQRFTAAAEVLEGKDSPGGSAMPSGGAAAGDMSGQLGQILGQVGQQVGQMAQSIAQPLQGLAQGLQQIPQQIMQGVQQASQAKVSDLPDVEDEKKDRRPEVKPKDDRDKERDEHAEGRAEAGSAAPSERAPVETPAPKQRPAATRPQAD